MDVFEEMTTMGHERVVVCSKPDVGLKAIIAIHSTTLGPGLGGVRMWPYGSFDEALTDVLRLSRGMTYKAAATGINLGGAKAVIIGDSKTAKSEALLRAFGRFVDSQGGDYITAEDVGMTMDDMAVIMTETNWVTGTSIEHGGSGNPAPFTARGVLLGLKAAVRFVFGDDSVKGRRIAVQGLGSVGGRLAAFLIEEGAEVIGCDVDADAIERARQTGIEIVDPDDILDVECDVFAPCALGASINPETIPKLKCKIVAGAANNQLGLQVRDGQALFERGIVYAPDFVLNAGGLINVYNELNGYNKDRVLSMTHKIYQSILTICETARDQNIPTYVAANRIAEQRIEDISKLGARHWSRFITDRDKG